MSKRILSPKGQGAFVRQGGTRWGLGIAPGLGVEERFEEMGELRIPAKKLPGAVGPVAPEVGGVEGIDREHAGAEGGVQDEV